MNPELFQHYPFPNKLPCDLGRYRLESVLGEGGMGIVFRGHEVGAGAVRFSVAIKVIRFELLAGSPALAADVIREARLAAELNHPNIVRTQYVGEDHGIPYIVSELLDGVDAEALIGRLAPGQVVTLLAGMARGLGHLHAQGLVHRDVKPSTDHHRLQNGLPTWWAAALRLAPIGPLTSRPRGCPHAPRHGP